MKNVIDVYCGNGVGQMVIYEEDFESFLLQDTASYYSRKASRWSQEDSCPDYMLKAEECLKLEKERVTNYLHSTTEPKLVEVYIRVFCEHFDLVTTIYVNTDNSCFSMHAESTK